eukprot:SAG31_NODE_18606_length_630_cov_0.551789_1_plen_45_part_01
MRVGRPICAMWSARAELSCICQAGSSVHCLCFVAGKKIALLTVVS